MGDEELRLLEERNTALAATARDASCKLYWPVRALALLGGFALGAILTRDWNQGMAKAVFRGGELLEDWKFEAGEVARSRAFWVPSAFRKAQRKLSHAFDMLLICF